MIPTALAIVTELEKYRKATIQKDAVNETDNSTSLTDQSSTLKDIVIVAKIPATE